MAELKRPGRSPEDAEVAGVIPRPLGVAELKLLAEGEGRGQAGVVIPRPLGVAELKPFTYLVSVRPCGVIPRPLGVAELKPLMSISSCLTPLRSSHALWAWPN